MKAARVHRFGPPDVIVIDEIPRPTPGDGEVLVRVAASGVGPWDAIIRGGKSKVSPPPPVTLGSDLSGVVEAVGAGAHGFTKGAEVYGVTNPQFCGANAEYALVRAAMMAHKPQLLNHVESASVPVVAVTAWQMLFEYANVASRESVLIVGAAGNVGAYAVQLAAGAGLHAIAVAHSRDAEYLAQPGRRSLSRLASHSVRTGSASCQCRHRSRWRHDPATLTPFLEEGWHRGVCRVYAAITPKPGLSLGVFLRGRDHRPAGYHFVLLCSRQATGQRRYGIVP